MLIKLTLITSLLNVTFLSYDVESKRTMILEKVPAKNATLPELMAHYKYKTISPDSAHHYSLLETPLLDIQQ